MIDILNRVRNKELQAKIVTAEEAAAFIKPGMNVGTSGFTPSGYPKAVPMALAARMEKEHFQINLWTGASTGDEEDGALARANGIKFRMPYQTNKDMRNAINSGKIDYCDLHLSESAQLARYGFLGGKIDVAIVEACAITEEGNIIPTTSMGNSASYVETADVVIVEVNTTQPMELEGMHDVYVPLDPPNRLPIPIVKPNDRIGTPYILTRLSLSYLAIFRIILVHWVRLMRIPARCLRISLSFSTRRLLLAVCQRTCCHCSLA